MNDVLLEINFSKVILFSKLNYYSSAITKMNLIIFLDNNYVNIHDAILLLDKKIMNNNHIKIVQEKLITHKSDKTIFFRVQS